MVMMISEPTGPRIMSTASSSVRPSTLSPSTWVMKSPAWMPAVGGGRAVHRRDDLDEAFFLRDLDAEAAELAAGLHLHVVEVVGGQVAGMRVERGEHAVDRGLDQLLGLDLLDILGADAFEDVAEQVELFVDRCDLLGLLRDQRAGDLRGQQRPCHACRHRAAITNFFIPSRPIPLCRRTIGAGSTGSVPSPEFHIKRFRSRVRHQRRALRPETLAPSASARPSGRAAHLPAPRRRSRHRPSPSPARTSR